MVPIPSVDPPVTPEATDVLCVPDTVPPTATEPQGPDTPMFPPPSKVEPDAADPDIPVAIPEIPIVLQGEVLVVEPSASGLRPPGSSSVDPKGMPTGPTAPVPASGEVTPIPGKTVCAMAGAAQRISIAAAIGSRQRIQILHHLFQSSGMKHPPLSASRAVVEADFENRSRGKRGSPHRHGERCCRYLIAIAQFVVRLMHSVRPVGPPVHFAGNASGEPHQHWRQIRRS
jgi:hypothetical protein